MIKLIISIDNNKKTVSILYLTHFVDLSTRNMMDKHMQKRKWYNKFCMGSNSTLADIEHSDNRLNDCSSTCCFVVFLVQKIIFFVVFYDFNSCFFQIKKIVYLQINSNEFKRFKLVSTLILFLKNCIFCVLILKSEIDFT